MFIQVEKKQTLCSGILRVTLIVLMKRESWLDWLESDFEDRVARLVELNSELERPRLEQKKAKMFILENL